MTRTRPDIIATRVTICNHRFFIHVLKYFFDVFYIDLAEGLLEEDSRKDDGEYRPGGQDHLLDGERHLLQGEVRHQAVAAGDDAPAPRFTISTWGWS